MSPKDIRYWKKVIESSFDADAEQLDEIAPIVAAGARAAVTAAGTAVGKAAGQALADKALGSEVDESEDDDLPTGEYKVCDDCHGEGCINCEHGLIDITGKFKKPDFSDFKFVDENADDAYYDSHVSSGTDQYNAVLHLHRDDFPLKHIKNTLRKIGMPHAAVVRSHLPHHIAVKMPRNLLAAAKERLWPHKDLEETYSSPPPFGDMIAAGFPDVAPGDRIRTRKGNGYGIVSTIRVHPKKGTEEVFFVDDNGKKWKTALSNVLKVNASIKEEELDEAMFKDGDKVHLKPEYADSPSEVFWVSQCDYDRKRCWIGDAQGRGWYASFGQLIPAKRKKKQVFEVELSWISLGEEMSVNDKIDIIEEYYVNGNLTESIDENKKEQFLELFNLSEAPQKNQSYIVVPLSLVMNRVVALGKPSYMEYVGKSSDGFVFRSSTGQTVYPPKGLREKLIVGTFTFSTVDAYDKFRFVLSLSFDIDLPDVNLTEETNLNEVYGLRAEMEYKGFRFYEDEDREEDNIKIWHIIETPGGAHAYLDHTPYEHMDEATFQNYVDFYIANGRFPNREDINSRGPLHKKDLANLLGR